MTLPLNRRQFVHRATLSAEEVTKGIDLSGQTIAITGANSGLGYETMRVLALRGAHVIGIARTQAKAVCCQSPGAFHSYQSTDTAGTRGRARSLYHFKFRPSPRRYTHSFSQKPSYVAAAIILKIVILPKIPPTFAMMQWR